MPPAALVASFFELTIGSSPLESIIPITLTDAVGNQVSISAGYVDGKFFISEFKESYILTHETVRAYLNGIFIHRW
ncbi:hypothetical protein L1267_12275 [Pseudoalteromonas sp. OFAV1]|uniref:hypothetical protein n=1 Tax=Pseudoalteromonas sp. OFAV1 TaxID=2908892 RepID=UPI001F283098|nr:hypothetical protein [Pseudoalteromonas sp. OFAV1]MCF2901168.1 hypothetical protein [Pseudoalteromonas sp. OFAV1]